MIKVRPSPTADTRTCDFANVTEQQLYESSIQHIMDVQKALTFFSEKIANAAYNHENI